MLPTLAGLRGSLVKLLSPASTSGNVAITVAGSLVDFSARTFQDSLAEVLRTRKPGEVKTLGVRGDDGVVVDVCFNKSSFIVPRSKQSYVC